MASRGIPLGPGPRPTTGDELARRIRASAAEQLAGLPVSGLDGAGVEAELDGADIVRLRLDLTGVEIALPEQQGPDSDEDGASPPPATARTPARLRELVVAARPAVLGGAEVDLDLRLEDLPVEWVDRADGRLELDAPEEGTAEGVRGEASLVVTTEDLGPLVASALNLGLAGVGASVSDVALEITGDGPDAASIDATARARYGVMSAGVRLLASVTIVDGRRIRLHGLDLSTKNLLAGALLGLARGELEKLEGTELDLADALPAGVEHVKAHLDVVSGAVAVRASFG